MEPKCLFAMIEEWQDIEDYHAQLQAYVNNGGEIDKRQKSHDPEPEDYGLVHPDCF